VAKCDATVGHRTRYQKVAGSIPGRCKTAQRLRASCSHLLGSTPTVFVICRLTNDENCNLSTLLTAADKKKFSKNHKLEISCTITSVKCQHWCWLSPFYDFFQFLPRNAMLSTVYQYRYAVVFCLSARARVCVCVYLSDCHSPVLCHKNLCYGRGTARLNL